MTTTHSTGCTKTHCHLSGCRDVSPIIGTYTSHKGKELVDFLCAIGK
jgi:hypothetical protein